MPVCQTKFHGALPYDPEQVLNMPAGFFGFAEEKQFLLLELPSLRPLAFIQSIRTPGLCFITLPAQVVDPDYCLFLPPQDVEALGYPLDAPPVMGRQLLCLALLTASESQATTANLLAPVVIDIAQHRGLQTIVAGPYSHQHTITSLELHTPC